jgi:ParB family chromosome partitioning protein
MNMITNIDITRLLPHPNNPRRDLGDLAELSESIKSNGVLQNLTVVPFDMERYKAQIGRKKAYEGNYIIIIGHRRHAGAKLAGLKEIPCAVSCMDEKTQISTMLLENVQRTDLKYSEQAQGFQLLLDLGETESSIAELTGFSKTTIRRRVNLLKLDRESLQIAEERGVQLGDYDELNKIKDIKLRNEVLKHIGTNNFKWHLQEAIRKEKREKSKAAVIKKLEEFATEVDDQGDLEYIDSFGFHGVDVNHEVEKPEDSDTIKYFFKVKDYYIYLYAETDENEADDDDEDDEDLNEIETKQRELTERKNKLNELSKTAYQSRHDFIKNFNPKKEHHPTIFEFAGRAIFEQYCEEEMALEILGIEVDDEEHDAEPSPSRIASKANTSIEKVVTVLSFAALDAENQPFHYNNCTPKSGEALQTLYYYLQKLGYEISDEESALLDGTHELFVKGDKY